VGSLCVVVGLLCVVVGSLWLVPCFSNYEAKAGSVNTTCDILI
jgi:hypothetical protein